MTIRKLPFTVCLLSFFNTMAVRRFHNYLVLSGFDSIYKKVFQFSKKILLRPEASHFLDIFVIKIIIIIITDLSFFCICYQQPSVLRGC